jgi:hypothetical protein
VSIARMAAANVSPYSFLDVRASLRPDRATEQRFVDLGRRISNEANRRRPNGA